MKREYWANHCLRIKLSSINVTLIKIQFIFSTSAKEHRVTGTLPSYLGTRYQANEADQQPFYDGPVSIRNGNQEFRVPEMVPTHAGNGGMFPATSNHSDIVQYVWTLSTDKPEGRSTNWRWYGTAFDGKRLDFTWPHLLHWLRSVIVDKKISSEENIDRLLTAPSLGSLFS
jgi:hypothetical protein